MVQVVVRNFIIIWEFIVQDRDIMENIPFWGTGICGDYSYYVLYRPYFVQLSGEINAHHKVTLENNATQQFSCLSQVYPVKLCSIIYLAWNTLKWEYFVLKAQFRFFVEHLQSHCREWQIGFRGRRVIKCTNIDSSNSFAEFVEYSIQVSAICSELCLRSC